MYSFETIQTWPKSSERWIGWHFLPSNGRCCYGKHRKPAPRVTAVAKGPLKLCKNGLHASRRAIDALNYAPGPICCLVELSGKIVEYDDKACARRRTIIAMADVSEDLQLFACWCAERALKQANVTNPYCWEAIKVKREWLAGKATDDQLADARAAAMAQEWVVAAMHACWAASYAALAVPHVAARNAALSGAGPETRNETWEETWAIQNKELERRLRKSLGIKGSVNNAK